MRPENPRITAISAAILLLSALSLVSTLSCRQLPNRPATVADSPSPVGESIALVQHESTPEDNGVVNPLPLAEDIATPTPEEPDFVGGQSVEYFVGIAVSGHPRIRAARARVAAAANRVPQAESLEDPLLSNNFYPISDQALQTAGGRAGNTLSLAQKYPWPEKRWTKGAIADRETQIAAAKLAEAELEVEEMVRLAYYELWFADRALKITDDNRQIAAELVNLAEARNAAGGSQQDILRAQLQLDALDNRRIELRRQKAVAQADLAALVQQPGMMGIEPTAEIDTGQVPERLDALFAAAQECSPRLRERRWAVSRDRQKQELACLGKYPDIILGAGWQTITESAAISPVANGHDNVNFMVGITLPIWRDRINAAIREASAEVAASNRDFTDARDDAFRQIRRLSEQAYAADEQLRLYHHRILPRAKRALQLASAEYRGRQVDFGEVASGFTEVLMFELQVVRAQATLAGTMAQLHRAVGCEVIVDEQ
ncbi:TolC family protein [Bythopirellula polymerisocia]|uniref:Outer membrane efflux protein n=1 Tax=Bythopirellula polymerisocia TaxID=2528003 RepID=A0A5C6CF59_9BACT|nr:TolC family protein [Bythopirellula polymerisocia]TWU22752.1 Outer membrane efflux protein [Bythopirellula polymerisocia]